MCDLISNQDAYPGCDFCEFRGKHEKKELTQERRAEITLKRKTELGCIGEERPGLYRLFDGTPSGRCPRIYQRGALWDYVRSYLWLDKAGIWPVAGGLLDQPAKVVSAFEVIRGCLMQIEQKRREEAEAKR